MSTLPTGILLASATGDSATFLGEDLVGWRTALIAAVVAAVSWELVMAATRRITLRIPFLVLRLARIGIPRSERERLHTEWAAELHAELERRDLGTLRQLVTGLRFAVPLALGGARTAAKARSTAPARQHPAPQTDFNLMRLAGALTALSTVLVSQMLPLSTVARALLLIGVGLTAGLSWYVTQQIALRQHARRQPHRHR
ncbi:hypothetical protein [Streptomyces sp. NPDC006333]|uniref:hypothetical protein n=1 Tax=Streptomyces sp. NPDC006333 TaxID=3156753 RepID=UPI0033B60E5D